jgi:hypothetical protein
MIRFLLHQLIAMGLFGFSLFWNQHSGNIYPAKTIYVAVHYSQSETNKLYLWEFTEKRHI